MLFNDSAPIHQQVCMVRSTTAAYMPMKQYKACREFIQDGGLEENDCANKAPKIACLSEYTSEMIS